MSLKRKFFVRQLLSLIGVVLLGAVAIWGFMDLHGQLGEALGGQDQTQTLQQIMVDAMRARASLGGTDLSRKAVAEDLEHNIEAMDTLVTQQSPGPRHVCSITSHEQLRHAKAALHHLKEAHRTFLQSGEKDSQIVGPLLGLAVDDLSDLFKLHTDAIHEQTAVAGQSARVALSTICGCLAICLAIGSSLSAMQYRGILLPLLNLHSRIRKGFSNSRTIPLEENGEREFSEVARAFNQMTVELNGFHRGMEQMVVAKSQELVRSERLASVGFLAAGVAHEINNPLNIISGFAELCARQLSKSGTGDAAVAETLSALQVIRDEAFRCKEITGRLLSLARGDSNARDVVSLKQVARDVALMTRALKHHSDRKIVLRFSEDEPLMVRANPAEMKQVLLNLTINALESVSSGSGEVRIEGQRTGPWIELRVSDNGKGISAESIKHVFEPFFTEKRGCAEPGTGLGLTITHAIIKGHGGRIRAESDGPGCGAQFSIQLPAIESALAD